MISMVATLQQSGDLKPGSSGRRRSFVAILLVVILFAFFAFLLRSYVGLKVQNDSKLHTLEHLLTDMQSLRPGISSYDEAMGLAKRYDARQPTEFTPCTRDQCTLEMHVTWTGSNRVVAILLGNRILSRLGIHFWEARGWVVIEKSIVTSYGAQIAVEDPEAGHLWHEATWTLFQEIPKIDEAQEKQFLRNFDPTRDKSPDFLVNWTNSRYADRVESLDARVSIRATDEQRHAAEDFNLKCLTQKGDCSNVCGLLPGAARYYNQGLSAAEFSFRHPRCD